MSTLRTHTVHLYDGPLHLRPMTEDDWDILLRWNTDPEVLYFSEGDDVAAWSLEEIQGIYRGTSQHAHNFVAEVDGRPIGECWLQRMNLERLLKRHAGHDVRRIDLMIGEKDLWGHGWGTRIIGLLTRFGFEEQRADVIYGVDVADYNPRSLRAFQKNGYVVAEAVSQKPGGKAKVSYDLVLTREMFEARRTSLA